ncbi:ABC transporter permease [Streptomyces sp. P6-2-1]|uniref:ABC transporter permease n=1 Tax=Streptomyces sp. P6-2-1 TaxID=3422591 RepID=UPI003D368D5A
MNRAPRAERARFRDLLAAERIKLLSLRSTPAVLAGTALVVLGVNANSARSNADRLAGQAWPEPSGTSFDALRTAFVDPAWQLLVVVLAVLGGSTLFGEYASGLLRTTFAAVPARGHVVLAKAALVTVLATVLGGFVSGASFWLTQALLRDHGGRALDDPGAARAVLAGALIAPVCALIGLAVGATVRHTAGSVGAALAVLLLLPALLQGERHRWVAELAHLLPLNAFRRLVTDPSHEDTLGRYVSSVPEAWCVYGAWALGAVVLAVGMVRRRSA